MKKFEDVKTAACVMMHDDDDYCSFVLADISKYTDQIYVNIHDATEYITKTVKTHPNVRRYIITDDSKSRGKWSQGLQRDNTIRLLDRIKPDIVLFPDSDETYPNNFKEQLKKFWEDENKKTFWFRLFYLWGDKKHFRNDGLWKTIHHVRAYKWQPSISYIPYAGYACPTTFIRLPRDTRYNSDSPIMHYGYMTEKNRRKKYLRAGPGYDYLRNREYRAHINKEMLIQEVPDELLWKSQL